MTFHVDDVTYEIGPATLLSGVSLTLATHEIVAVVGPNGAGKTTLVRALAGDIQPGRGRVSLDGRALSDWPAGELALRRAVMGPDSSVAFGYTAREVALMGRLPAHGGAPAEADDELIDGLLDAVDCAALADRVFTTLSNGERQRVQLARAVAQVSDATTGSQAVAYERFLLLDEPTSSLDPAHQHTAMRLVRREVERGRGALVVLHDLNLAAAYADRLMLMKDASVIATGTPAEMLRPELLEQVFEIPMLVLSDPAAAHPMVVAQPRDA